MHGPFEPENGLRFNPAKLLIDPYAKALAGPVDWNAPVFGYPLGNSDADLALDEQDDAAPADRREEEEGDGEAEDALRETPGERQ